MYTLIALLDKPSKESFGTVPLLIRNDDDGKLYCYRGAADKPPTTHSDDEYRMMMHHSRNVEALNVRLPEEPVGRIAGWLGAKFVSECWRLDLPEPLPTTRAHACVTADNPDCAEGTFWIAPTTEVDAQIDAWHLTAARRAIRERNPEIADLMQWCLPMNDETLAAKWLVATPGKHRYDEVTWSLRMLLPRERGLTREALINRFKDIIARFQSDP